MGSLDGCKLHEDDNFRCCGPSEYCILICGNIYVKLMWVKIRDMCKLPWIYFFQNKHLDQHTCVKMTCTVQTCWKFYTKLPNYCRIHSSSRSHVICISTDFRLLLPVSRQLFHQWLNISVTSKTSLTDFRKLSVQFSTGHDCMVSDNRLWRRMWNEILCIKFMWQIHKHCNSVAFIFSRSIFNIYMYVSSSRVLYITVSISEM